MQQRGFSLVELMVALALSLVLMSGVLSIFFSSKVTYLANEKTARLQENGRTALDLIVHMERLRDGTRRVVKVSEVQGMEGSSVVMQDLFVFEQTGIQNGRVIGTLKPTGLRPKFADKFAVNNIELSADVFSAAEE